MNSKQLFLTINAVDFQSKSNLFVEKNVNLMSNSSVRLAVINSKQLKMLKTIQKFSPLHEDMYPTHSVMILKQAKTLTTTLQAPKMYNRIYKIDDY